MGVLDAPSISPVVTLDFAPTRQLRICCVSRLLGRRARLREVLEFGVCARHPGVCAVGYVHGGGKASEQICARV